MVLENGKGYTALAAISLTRRPLPLPPPSQCPRSRPEPTKPEITDPTQRAITGERQFSAAAPGAPLVGFAAYYEDRPGEPQSARWHRIGRDDSPDDGVSVLYNTRSMPGQGHGLPTDLAIAAVPCLAVDFPGARWGHRRYVVINPEPSQDTQRRQRRAPPPKLPTGAGEVACRAAAGLPGRPGPSRLRLRGGASHVGVARGLIRLRRPGYRRALHPRTI